MREAGCLRGLETISLAVNKNYQRGWKEMVQLSVISSTGQERKPWILSQKPQTKQVSALRSPSCCLEVHLESFSLALGDKNDPQGAGGGLKLSLQVDKLNKCGWGVPSHTLPTVCIESSWARTGSTHLRPSELSSQFHD